MFFDDMWHCSLFFLLESSNYSRKHIFLFFSKSLLCLLTARCDHDFGVFKTLFCWICTPKNIKHFFEKNVLGSYGDIKVYHFHAFSTFFQKSWSFCDFDPTYHWLWHFHFCFLAKFTQQTAVVKAFSTISVITLCSSRRVRWQLMDQSGILTRQKK